MLLSAMPRVDDMLNIEKVGGAPRMMPAEFAAVIVRAMVKATLLCNARRERLFAVVTWQSGAAHAGDAAKVSADAMAAFETLAGTVAMIATDFVMVTSVFEVDESPTSGARRADADTETRAAGLKSMVVVVVTANGGLGG